MFVFVIIDIDKVSQVIYVTSDFFTITINFFKDFLGDMTKKEFLSHFDPNLKVQ